VALAVALAVALTACGSSARHAAPTVPTSVTTRPPAPTTIPLFPTSGPRTVLSPIGLHLRATPSISARILGTAAQGTVLEVLGHVTQAGGWYEVKGATRLGWISDRRTASAPGKFAVFSSTPFGVLYPATWTFTRLPPATVIFRPASGSESIVVRTASTVTQLARGRAGYGQTNSETAVACGVTTHLDTYTAAPSAGTAGQATPEPYLAQIRLALDAHHALGIDANLVDLSEVQTVRDFVNSVTFPSPQCQG
jgi:hypothetical protein